MKDLKPLYDAAIAAEGEVRRVMSEIRAQLDLGTEEGKQAALDLRPALDEAKVKAEEANQLYISMRDADYQESDVGRKFVPVSDDLAEEQNPSQMKRSEFDALSPSERMALAKKRVKIVDDDEIN